MRCTRSLRVSNWRIISGTLMLAALERWPLGGSAVGSAYNGAKATTDSMRLGAQFTIE
jgi:hypothetical protein